MFTGIIEAMGEITQVQKDRSNIHFRIESPISSELKIDQSVAHDGVCLTVTKTEGNTHWVTAIDETLQRTNLQNWKSGTRVNLERCLAANGRFDGHIVQGHVDCTGILDSVVDRDGSHVLHFSHPPEAGITVEKGSICINGISLTVVESRDGAFSVAIIPYTWEHTGLRFLEPGDTVNLEFDIVGKYLQKIMHKTGA